MPQHRSAVFGVVRPWLDAKGFTRDRIDALDAALAAADVPPDDAASPAPAIVPKPQEAVEGPISPAQAMIDAQLLKVAFPQNNIAELALWVEPTRKACILWGIDTFREVASFLANISVESRGLTRLSESLNYSVQGLLDTFGRHRISAADAQRLGRKPGEDPLSADRQAEIANILYGGEFGRTQLGNTEPGDGWLCRGYGPKQVTGRANQMAFAEAMGIPFEEVAAFIRTRDGGMMSAGWFWKSHGLDAKAATPGLEDDRRAINGGLLGLDDVEIIFALLIAEMLRREKLA